MACLPDAREFIMEKANVRKVIYSMLKFIKKLGVDLSFRPEDGSFRSKLTETFVDSINNDCVEHFNEKNCDIQVSISRRTIEEGFFRFLVVCDIGEQEMECELSVLNDNEIRDLREQIFQQVQKNRKSTANGTTKVIVRKKPVDGMLNIQQAAQKLGCSQSFLKEKIPCTDYSYKDVNGKKEIKEFYWSQILIDRLSHLKLNGAKAEDVNYIARECCDGDYKWAKDILCRMDVRFVHN